VIVADLGDRYQFVTQPDHADLAGQFADHWGGAVARPDPFESLVVAAYCHDVGWETYDRRPRLDDEGEPVDFRGMPADPWIPLYEDGIDAVVDLDPYAGLLVSLHGTGLRNRRYGLSPEWPETPPAFEAFVEREEDRQQQLLDDRLAGEHGEGGRHDDGSDPARALSAADESTLAAMHDPDHVPEDPDGRLWADYCRLQAWDALSLSFCITDTPPGYGEVGPVPTADGSETLSITRADPVDSQEPVDGVFTVDPYPFDTVPLTVTVPTRTVDKALVDGASVDEPVGEEPSALARAYYGAGRETKSFRLRPRD
jgi:hypothetical protein